MDTDEKWEMEILEKDDIRESKRMQTFHKWEVTWKSMMDTK